MDRNDAIFASHLARVEMLMVRTGTEDSINAERAARNLVAGQPAFWTTATFSNAGAGILMGACNRHTGHGKRAVIEAAVECNRESPRHDHFEDRYLDTLLPLNEPAVAALVAAYVESGTFRQRHELRRRTERAEETPVEGTRLQLVELLSEKHRDQARDLLRTQLTGSLEKLSA